MAKIGEDWVKNVMISNDYVLDSLGNEDVIGYKDKLGIVVEEKDWKDATKVFKNKLYSRGIDGKWYYQKRGQVVQYGYRAKIDNPTNKYKFIVCCFVVSNLMGRQVQPIYFRKFGTIFVVHKAYFPVWLKSLERTYLGMPILETPCMYMGGK